MSRTTLIVILFTAGLLWFVTSTVRRSVPVLNAAGPTGFGLIFEDCPKCRHQVVLSPGKEARCDYCKERLAACESCGRTLQGAEVAEHVSGTAWLCTEHREESEWVSGCLRDFGTADGLTPPPDTRRALAARRHYETEVRDLFSQKKQPDEELFVFEKRQRPYSNTEAAEGFPKGVIEVYQFYERAVMSQDNGTVGIFPWDLEGSPLYLVHCNTDGSNGFLEIYDADGTPLGFARTESAWPVWTSKGVVRRRAFTGDRDEIDQQLAAAVKRIQKDTP